MAQVVLAQQATKVKLLKLPVYDYETDTFLNLPKDFDVDRHFKRTQKKDNGQGNQMI